MSQPPPLPIAKPCTADWNAMSGDERKRLCAHCNKHVHNLSALNEREFDHWVAARNGDECIGYEVRADGTIVTAPSWPRLARWSRPLARAAVWLLTPLLPTFFSGCSTPVQRLAGTPPPLDKTIRKLLGEAPPVPADVPQGRKR